MRVGLFRCRSGAQEWLERRVIGESTRRNYEGFIQNHLVPHLGRKMLAALARRDFEEFARDVHASGAGLAVSTVNDRMVTVAAMLEAADVDKRIPDPCARRPDIPGGPVRWTRTRFPRWAMWI
ncbi:tyrosine-type recombinase/integrase [Streptomyces sp. NPDC003032]